MYKKKSHVWLYFGGRGNVIARNICLDGLFSTNFVPLERSLIALFSSIAVLEFNLSINYKELLCNST
jgi:hypothetical protein